MIPLNDWERDVIKLTKLHYENEYPFKKTWSRTIIPLFFKHYGWGPNECRTYKEYQYGLFNILLNIHLKINVDYSGNNLVIQEVFEAILYKSFAYQYSSPLERGIAKLCGLIQCSIVEDEDGVRFEL